MKELLRANDPVLLSWIVDRLAGEDIEAVVLDTHTSILEGSVNAIPRRVMVHDDDYTKAKYLLDVARRSGLAV